MRVGLAALVVMASIIAGTPASAASLRALPAEVRVNIGGLGFSYVVLSSTGTLSAIAPDGTLLYRGDGKVVARTNVRSLRASGVELPPPRSAGSMSPDERADRAALRRDARLAVADSGPLAVLTVRFQLSLLQAGGDEQGTIALQSDTIQNVKLRATDGLLLLNGHPYRGTFELAADDEGDLTVVNIVSTHDYLASVVGSEVPTSWENEMLAAQAIAARTYLYTHLGRHKSYDLEGDTRDQQYDGTIKEDPRTLRAVERTAGVIATYRGAPIEALYSANAGGITEDSENVFPNALPYLRSVASPSDVVARDSSWGASSWQWTRELSATQLRDFLGKRGVAVGTPTGIQLTSVSPTGRVITAKILGTAGSYDVGKDRSRYYFGLLSSLFTVAVTPTGANERVGATNDARIAALEALGARVVQTSFEMLLDPNGNELGLRPTGFVYELPARFVFTGKGFGHGVGMSQWGAQGLALGGATYSEILTHYYSGIALTPVGGG